MIGKIHFRNIWVVYFCIKLFYMVFAIFVFSRLTTLGDTFDYLHAPLYFSPKIFYSSTAMMQFLGAVCKLIFRADVLACLPFMLLSFYGVYYAVDRLNLYPYATYVLVLFSLPNFGVWTSILGKEAVGCFFSCVIAVILIKKIKGQYQLKLIDYAALYLCAIFKPQYLLFIMQAFVFLFITKRFSDKKYFPLALGIAFIAINVLALYYLRDLVDGLAKGMAIHFRSSDPNLAHSTRSEAPWLMPYGFFYAAPYGMFIAFFGPTLSEMLSKPAQLIAGLESIVMIICLVLLVFPRSGYILKHLRFNPTIFITYFIIIIGILFIHYPFGFLNPGSAIRYRSNFYALFVLMLLYLFVNQIQRFKLPGAAPQL
ncbi:hypothetical protein [Mucilaginibacter sp. HD30]